LSLGHTVVKVEGEIIQILTDVSRDEIRVFRFT
jgi:hypothetical protein